MLTNIKLIIYDLDGVLIDSSNAILKAFKRTLEEIGVEVKPQEILGRIGMGLIDILEELLPKDNCENLWKLRDRYIHHFQDLGPEHTFLLPDVKETLSEIKELGIMQSVATNKTKSEADRLLGMLGVRHYLDFVTGFMDVPNAKPAPDMILHTLKALKIDKKNVVFIDDTTTGLTAGIRAGVSTVGITTGIHDKETLSKVGPNYIIDSLHEIKKILK
jgi:HAD superfamily hydrolase (TIGR01509 family)